jgi:hypothetical protein
MISTGQILAAGAITAAAVALAAAVVRWPLRWLAGAAVMAFILIVVWRWISNIFSLNGDYLPAVSTGDTVCLVAGALGPAALATVSSSLKQRWVPAVVGGVVAFIVNVAIL